MSSLQKRKIIQAVAVGTIVLLLLITTGSLAFATDKESLNINARGSLSVTMREVGRKIAVPGGKLTIYQVAEIHSTDTGLSYAYLPDFADCGLQLGDLTGSKFAHDLKNYAKSNQLIGTTKTIGADGKVIFDNISLGLYLVVQNKAANGYYAVTPFLVSVPTLKNGSWIYQVDATPKVELVQKKKLTDTPKKTTSLSFGSKLPQTGQLNWPVPVLAICGLLLFAFGWGITFTRRKKNDAP